MQIDTTLPCWAEEILCNNYLYNLLFGGRAGGKTEALCKIGILDVLTVDRSYANSVFLCCREVQNSLDDSTYACLKSHIFELGVDKYFKILEYCIIYRPLNIKFVFKGLYRNIESIKGIRNIKRIFLDEAASISKESWEILVPTALRNEGCKFYIAMNPKNETDVIYKDLIIDTPENAYVKKVSYRDNPYELPANFYAELERMKKRDHAMYLHVYEGECLKLTEAVIFKNYFKAIDFEIDTSKHLFVGLDFGFSQSATACVGCYIKDNNLYVCYEAVKKKLDIDKTADFISERIPDFKNSVCYADNARPETITFMKNQNCNIKAVEKGKSSIKDGIEYLKTFDNIFIHANNCKHTVDEFNKYSYKVCKRSGEILNEIEDKNNDAIDALRYALEKQMKNRNLNYNNWVKNRSLI